MGCVAFNISVECAANGVSSDSIGCAAIDEVSEIV